MGPREDSCARKFIKSCEAIGTIASASAKANEGSVHLRLNGSVRQVQVRSIWITWEEESQGDIRPSHSEFLDEFGAYRIKPDPPSVADTVSMRVGASCAV